MIRTRQYTTAAAAAAILWSGLAAFAEDTVSFNRDIRRILSNNCYDCHGPDDNARKRRPRLDLYETAIAPARSGAPPIVPGDPENSELYFRIVTDDPDEIMPPPKTNKTLTAAEKELIRQWIAEGAEYEPHWSYVPPTRPELPKVQDGAWPQNEIDRFVLARLEDEGIAPSPQADPYTLYRRVHLDLTGLPPDPDEAEAFAKNPTDEAYEATVDRLLASPRYGEHWARKWLDLARYADTKGYEKDAQRTMWPYRDWVIRALNEDMPYDQFTREQLAGDLVDDPTRDQIIATAFHRNTPTNDEGGTDDEEFRVAAVVDRVNTTMQAWMGTTMGCAQCHTHKYDPISQTEYYRFFAFLNQTQDADRDPEDPFLWLYGEDDEERIARLEEKLAEKDEKLRKAKKTLESALGQEKDDAKRDLDIAERQRKEAADRVKELKNSIPRMPIMAALPEDERRETHVLIRGSFLDKGDPVEPGVPQALHPFPEDAPLNRLGLAEWLMADDNPLTARVAVNRHWEQFFGLGLVETSEEFGTQGELPSHPELLDWLAVEFRESGWSFKHLCKTIVMSATYRQDSTITPDGWERDRYNRLLARGPRFRLSAEAIRDQSLAAAGLLSEKMYGPPVMPPQPDGIWQIVYSSDSWNTSAGEDRYRRGIYTFWRRSSPYPAMVTFDATPREVCTVRRSRTNTPLQALVTLNDPAFVEAAQGLARRMYARDGADIAAKLGYGFRLAATRPPTESELQTLMALYEGERANFAANEEAAVLMATDPLGPIESGDPATLAALTVVGNVLLNMDETLTKG